MNVWPKGEYDFEVIKAERAISGDKSKTPGTEFIKLNLKIYADDGACKFVNGILHPAMEAQVRHFCAAGGIIDKYETGSLTADDCVGVSGRVKIKIKPAEGNFPEKNEVADYIVPKAREEAAAVALPATPEDDDVPF